MAAKRETKNRMRSTRSATLALVAMLELLLLCVSLTFSWFERAQDPVLFGQEIKTADALLSTYRVSPGDDTVELTQFFDHGVPKKFSPIQWDDDLQFSSPTGIPLSTSEIYGAALSFEFNVISESLNCEFWFDTLELKIGSSVFTVDESGMQNNHASNNVEEPPIETSSEAYTEEETSEAEIDEAMTELVPTESSETEETVTEENEEEPVSEETEEEAVSEEVTDSEEPVTEEDFDNEEEEPETRDPASVASYFHIAFKAENGSPVIMSLAEAYRYFANGTTLFSCEAGELTSIKCYVWLAYEEGVIYPEGENFSIEMSLTNSLNITRTIWLKDETTQLSTMYPQMLTDGYRVELVDPASGVIFPATYDEASGAWYAELPVAIASFDVRYRSKSIGRDVLATWESINGEFVHSFALMDEGVFLKSES